MTDITKDESTGQFIIKAKHWEPQNYINYMKQGGGSKKGFLESLLSSVSMAVAVSLLLTRVVFKEKQALQMFPQLMEMLGHDRPWDVLITLTLIVIITTGLMLRKTSAGERKGNGDLSPPVGEGGDLVSVDDMKVGGSGSCAVMDGKTIAIETIRSRYVVNAAGCYSDKIAQMIGDNTFQIKPRLGNYILLNRNQVSTGASANKFAA